jgi:hypothetical protein
MALLPSTLGRAGPLSTTIVNLEVVEHGCVVSVGGEIDTLTAPQLDPF